MTQLLDMPQATSINRLPDFEERRPLDGLPIIEANQADPLNPDRALGFPHVLYHGTKAQDFTLDDKSDHRSASVGIGARTGKGLYAASESISQRFGAGNVVELIPSDVHLIDLSSEASSVPLSDSFKASYLADYEANIVQKVQSHFPTIKEDLIQSVLKDFEQSTNLISKQEVVQVMEKIPGSEGGFEERTIIRKFVKELASQVNIARVIGSFEAVSIKELFASYDIINGESRVGSDVEFGISPLIDFLTQQGIDGAVTVQKFGEGDTKESGVVFWKLDKVGDKETWMRRLARLPQVIGRAALMDSSVTTSAPKPE